MKYYIIAGEASGDLHASNLMHELKKLDATADFRCWGGDLMEKAGGRLVKHYRDLAFMGFLEVIMNLRTILRNMRFCRRDILEYQPDVLLLVDYPGFNLRMARFASQHGIRVFYYISPQLWAWKKSRVHKVKSYVDRMFVILPFEKDFYKRYDYEVDFVGHPLLDAIDQEGKPGDTFRREAGLDERPVVAVLPGSRKQEISTMLPLMLSLEEDFPAYQFVVAAASSVPEHIYERSMQDKPVKMVKGKMHELLKCSHAALVTSGTATLETALLNVPEVVCYKGGWISYFIARRLIRDIRFISLVNLIMDREVVKELIQGDLNAGNLKDELTRLVSDDAYRRQMMHDMEMLREKLGGAGASEKAARLMYERLLAADGEP
jgi:lipid-A-disaccharide synthase